MKYTKVVNFLFCIWTIQC